MTWRAENHSPTNVALPANSPSPWGRDGVGRSAISPPPVGEGTGVGAANPPRSDAASP